MREVTYHGLILQKLQPGVYKLDLAGSSVTIESRGIYLFLAYDEKRKLIAQAGSLPALCKELRGLDPKKEQKQQANESKNV